MTRIEREDLEAKLREIQGVFDETKASAQNGLVVGAVVVVVIIALAFLFGRRKGKKGSAARIEVYQVR